MVMTGPIRITALLLAALSPLAACGGPGEPAEPVRRTVVFELDIPHTRTAVTAHEADVTSLDLLVYRVSDGSLDCSARLAGEDIPSVSAPLSMGMELRYYVIANAPEGMPDAYGDEQSLLSGVTLLTHGSADGLVMWGTGGLVVEGDVPAIPVTLRRYACKVTLGSVSARFLDGSTPSTKVCVGRVALVNVTGSTPWSGEPECGDVWYNRGGVYADLPAKVKDMTVADFGTPVPDSSPVTLDAALYCMPNPTDNGVNGGNSTEWSVRNTRLALELLVDGVANWYPLDLPAMQCNTNYVIERLILLGPGSDSPDKPVSRSEAEFSVSVTPWTEAGIEGLFT